MYIPPSSLKTFQDGEVVVALDFNQNFSTIVAAVNDNDARISTLMTASGGGFSINVKSSTYGAKGDGVTDDTAAIQAAINYAISTGVPVYFPRGNYVVSNTLSLSTVSGLGDAILFGDGNAFIWMYNTSLPTIDVTSTLYSCTISKLNFKYQGTTIVTGTSSNVHINISNTSSNLKYIDIDGCYFDTTRAGLNTGNTYVYAINAYGVVQSRIKNCVFSPYLQSAIRLRYCSGVEISNCDFMATGNSAIQLQTAAVQSIPIPLPAGMAHYDTTGNTSCSKISIRNNNFAVGGYSSSAVEMYRANGVDIVDNTLTASCSSDVSASTGGSFITSYGVINGASGATVVPYRDYCTDVQIRGNLFNTDIAYAASSTSTRGGLYLNNLINAVISENSFEDIGDSNYFAVPVDVRYSYSVVVSGNSITRCRNKTTAIYMSTVVGFAIKGNVFLDAFYGALPNLVSVFTLQDRGVVSDPFSSGTFVGNTITSTNSTYRYTALYTDSNGNYMVNTQYYLRMANNQVINGFQSGYTASRIFDEIDDLQLLTWAGGV